AGSRAVVEIAREAREARLERGELRERRDGAAHARIEIRARPAPVRSEKAVRAVVRDRQRLRLDTPEDGTDLVQAREDRAVDGDEGREIVAREPEGRCGRIPREDDDA